MSRFVIGLAGGTGSGKTTVARNIIGRLALDSITVFQQDAYYRDLADLSPAQRTSRNFDHPDSIEIELFVSHLGSSRTGFPWSSRCTTSRTTRARAVRCAWSLGT
jgi:uridine kinase